VRRSAAVSVLRFKKGQFISNAKALGTEIEYEPNSINADSAQQDAAPRSEINLKLKQHHALTNELRTASKKEEFHKLF
jgi:hypothetical protein